jgi:hypothetical protein
MLAQVVDGDLLEQPVEAIVNAWNRNVIPWWLLLPQGFLELSRNEAVSVRSLNSAAIRDSSRACGTHFCRSLTLQGNHPCCCINMFWRASQESIQTSVVAAMTIVQTHQFASVAFPVVGAGSGG